MSAAVLLPEAHALFAANYTHAPAKLTHRLRDYPLLRLDALAGLTPRCGQDPALGSERAAAVDFAVADLALGMLLRRSRCVRVQSPAARNGTASGLPGNLPIAQSDQVASLADLAQITRRGMGTAG